MFISSSLWRKLQNGAQSKESKGTFTRKIIFADGANVCMLIHYVTNWSRAGSHSNGLFWPTIPHPFFDWLIGQSVFIGHVVASNWLTFVIISL